MATVKRGFSSRPAESFRVGTGEDISVFLDTKNMVRLANALADRFRGGFNDALTAANLEAAEKVKNGMVKELERHVAVSGRPQRDGKRLEVALDDDQNVLVAPNFYQVGIESWLNKSPAALYWRRIEEGDPNTFTARILFTNSGGYGPVGGGPYYRPGRLTGGLHMRMKQFRGVGSTRGVLVQGIGPFPEYKFSAGGFAAQRKIDMAAVYAKHLRNAGINVRKGDSAVFKTGGK